MLILILPVAAGAQLILSEVLANEPGDTVQLEWIELYNNQSHANPLDSYRLVVGADTIALPSYNSSAESYAILTRRLVDSSGRPSFESRWGNATGYWGDSPLETYLAVELNFQLRNTDGALYLINIALENRDSVIWSATSDGISLERDTLLPPPSDSWHLCTDPAGSTPGQANSAGSGPNDMTVDFDVRPRIINRSSPVKFQIMITTPHGSQALLEVFDDTARRIATIYDGPIANNVEGLWNKWDCDYRRLPPGIYFIRAEISGPINVTKTIPVVIAP
jgi:hypothetical protein